MKPVNNGYQTESTSLFSLFKNGLLRLDLHEDAKNCWELLNRCWLAEIRHYFRYYEKLPDICSLSIENTRMYHYEA